MQDFFNRNLTRPTIETESPKYLQPFKLPEKDELTQEIFDSLKTGEYNIKAEENMLTKLSMALNRRGDTAEKLLAQVGLVNLKKKMKELELNEGDGH